MMAYEPALKPVGNRAYLNLTYLAAQLLIKLGNHRSITEYRGLNAPIQQKSMLDVWVDGYKHAKQGAALQFRGLGQAAFVPPVAY